MRQAKKETDALITFTTYDRKSTISLVGGPHPYLWVGPTGPDVRSTIHTFGGYGVRSKRALRKLANAILKATKE